MTPAAVLDSFEKVLAVIGGLGIVVAPFALAYLKLRVHDAVGTAPAFLKLTGKVERVETWQAEHAEDVKTIPRLATILERVESAVTELTRTLRERQ